MSKMEENKNMTEENVSTAEEDINTEETAGSEGMTGSEGMAGAEEGTTPEEAAEAEKSDGDDDSGADGAGAGEGAPSGRKKKREKKDKRDELIEELNDKVKRQLAEFENFRNRSEKEKAGMFDMGARTIIEKILPVIDNFERGLAARPEAEEAKAFADGMEMVYKQLLTNLTEAGMAEIEAVGTEFNPDLHNAVMQVEDEDKESGTVAAELQKGYTYHGTVVRHSMVSVVQ